MWFYRVIFLQVKYSKYLQRIISQMQLCNRIRQQQRCHGRTLNLRGNASHIRCSVIQLPMQFTRENMFASAYSNKKEVDFDSNSLLFLFYNIFYCIKNNILCFTNLTYQYTITLHTFLFFLIAISKKSFSEIQLLILISLYSLQGAIGLSYDRSVFSALKSV